MKPTKTITFEGKQYEVPTWVRFVARTLLGSIRAYEFEPVFHRGDWHTDKGGCLFVVKTSNSLGWYKTLTEV